MPYFGYSGSGETNVSASNVICGSLHACSEVGTATRMYLYKYWTDTGTEMMMGIYLASDNSLVGYTEEVDAASGWIGADIVSGGSLSDTNYILCFWANGTCRGDAGSWGSGQLYTDAETYGDWPATLVPVEGNPRSFLILCEYTAGGPSEGVSRAFGSFSIARIMEGMGLLK